VACFEVRLIEAREDNMAVIGLKLGVDVLLTVSIIFEVLKTLAVAYKVRFKLDNCVV